MVPRSHPVLVCALRLECASSIQIKPGREADVNCQRKWETNDNWFVIQPKYLFHKFIHTTGIRFSVGVKKKVELRKKGRFSEGKTRGIGEWEGGANRINSISPCWRNFKSPRVLQNLVFLPQPGLLWGRCHFLTFCICSGTTWAKLTPPQFSVPRSPAESFLFPPQSPKPAPTVLGYPHPSCLLPLGQGFSPRWGSPGLFQSETAFLFSFFKKEGGSGVKGWPSIRVVVL